MPLLYKEDWEQTKQRYLAWWEGQALGRCALAVSAPKDNPPAAAKPTRPATPEQCWTDLDYISACCEYQHSRMFYGGEALPLWSGGYPGNKTQSVFLGCPITLDWDTGWVDPILADRPLEDVFKLKFDENEPHFQFAMRLLRRGAVEAAGKSLVSVGALGGCGDTLAWLRGSEQLLLDLVERPDVVREAELYLMDMWCEIYDRFYDVVRDVNEGSTGWFALWSPGKFYATENDFAYMISPKMFSEIFLPAIQRQTEFLDHAVHHVDGIGNFNHVPALCELPRLKAFQIGPGTGQPDALHFMDVLKEVQRKGKNLYIDLTPDRVQTALEHLSARGLFIATSCETQREAQELLKKAEAWSRD